MASKRLLRRGDSFGVLAVGVPMFRTPPRFVRWWTRVVGWGLEPGDILLDGDDIPIAKAFPIVHNAIARAMMGTEADTLLIVEDDHVADEEVVRRLRTKPENLGFDVVCASYSNRNEPGSKIVGVNLTGNRSEIGEYECRIDLFGIEESGTQVVDVAALGMVLIRRWVLEELLGSGDLDTFRPFEVIGGNSLDIPFYGKIKALGARVGVDRDNPIGHIGEKVFTMTEFYEKRRVFLAKKKKQEGWRWRISSRVRTWSFSMARRISARG